MLSIFLIFGLGTNFTFTFNLIGFCVFWLLTDACVNIWVSGLCVSLDNAAVGGSSKGWEAVKAVVGVICTVGSLVFAKCPVHGATILLLCSVIANECRSTSGSGLVKNLHLGILGQSYLHAEPNSLFQWTSFPDGKTRGPKTKNQALENTSYPFVLSEVISGLSVRAKAWSLLWVSLKWISSTMLLVQFACRARKLQTNKFPLLVVQGWLL